MTCYAMKFQGVGTLHEGISMENLTLHVYTMSASYSTTSRYEMWHS